MPPQPKPRSIRRLHLDLRNPRLGRPAVSSEDEAMERLLDKFGSKIEELAKSIAEHGLSPAESWMIVQEGGKSVVLEGNRRLVACRLLENPSKAPDEETKRTFTRIQASMNTGDVVRKPSCTQFERRADARYWIHLKHHGAGKGEGTAPWGPEMVYLDQVNNGDSPVEWNEFWYWLEDTYGTDTTLSPLVNEAREKQYTLMERAYRWALKDLLHAQFDTSSRKLTVDVDPQKIIPFVKALLTGMTQPQSEGTVVLSSRTLNDQESAKKLLEDLWARTIGTTDVTPKNPPVRTSPPTTSGNSAQPSPDTLSASTQTTPAPQPPASTSSSHASSSSRPNNRHRVSETHLYYGVTFSNMPPRVRDILKECARIEIKDRPQTAAVMARVAVELAVDAYIDHRSLNMRKTQLADKIKAVLLDLAPDLTSKNPQHHTELKGTWDMVRTDTTDGHFVRSLHNCVHDYRYTAALDMAERAHRYFTPLFNVINDNMTSQTVGPSVSTGTKNGQP